jgi:cysteine-S-conjugate beta-lyase
MKEQTKVIHTDYTPPSGFAAIPYAVHRASTVIFANVAAMRSRNWKRKDGYTYGLHGTPTTFMLEAQLARLEGGKHTLLTPSGLAAITLVNLTLLNAGDEVLLPDNVYGPSKEQAELLLSRLGITHRLYDPMQPEALQFTANTKLLWLEAPGSVTMEVPDVPALVKQAKAHGVLTAIDNTWAAGIAFKPFVHGIDVSIQAATKFQAGSADVLMGSVTCVDDALAERLKFTHMRLGIGVSAEDTALVLRSLPTMRMRYAASDVASRQLAAWLATQPQVARVLHPALPSCTGHAHWQRDFNHQAAGLFSIVFEKRFTQAQVDEFVDSLQLFKIGYSWAGPVSLAVPYDMRTMRTAAPWTEGALVRLWIGLESVEDLQADLAQAIHIRLK